jgi:hypothetical protein
MAGKDWIPAFAGMTDPVVIWGQLVKSSQSGKEGLDYRMRGNDKQFVVPAQAGTFRVRSGRVHKHDYHYVLDTAVSNWYIKYQ